MKKLVTAAALLTAIGGGAALAQGTPPSLVPWQSGWHGPVAASPALGTLAMRPSSRVTLARKGGSVPIAGNALGRSRGG